MPRLLFSSSAGFGCCQWNGINFKYGICSLEENAPTPTMTAKATTQTTLMSELRLTQTSTKFVHTPHWSVCISAHHSHSHDLAMVALVVAVALMGTHYNAMFKTCYIYNTNAALAAGWWTKKWFKRVFLYRKFCRIVLRTNVNGFWRIPMHTPFLDRIREDTSIFTIDTFPLHCQLTIIYVRWMAIFFPNVTFPFLLSFVVCAFLWSALLCLLLFHCSSLVRKEFTVQGNVVLLLHRPCQMLMLHHIEQLQQCVCMGYVGHKFTTTRFISSQYSATLPFVCSFSIQFFCVLHPIHYRFV